MWFGKLILQMTCLIRSSSLLISNHSWQKISEKGQIRHLGLPKWDRFLPLCLSWLLTFEVVSKQCRRCSIKGVLFCLSWPTIKISSHASQASECSGTVVPAAFVFTKNPGGFSSSAASWGRDTKWLCSGNWHSMALLDFKTFCFLFYFIWQGKGWGC